jgi:hypothetical protein
MTEQAINKEFSAYFSLLSPSQKESILGLIKSFLIKEKKNVKPISRKQYNKEIDIAVKQIAKGYYITQEDLEKESEKW